MLLLPSLQLTVQPKYRNCWLSGTNKATATQLLLLPPPFCWHSLLALQHIDDALAEFKFLTGLL